jgi:hypothetical protein
MFVTLDVCFITQLVLILSPDITMSGDGVSNLWTSLLHVWIEVPLCLTKYSAMKA